MGQPLFHLPLPACSLTGRCPLTWPVIQSGVVPFQLLMCFLMHTLSSLTQLVACHRDRLGSSCIPDGEVLDLAVPSP